MISHYITSWNFLFWPPSHWFILILIPHLNLTPRPRIRVFVAFFEFDFRIIKRLNSRICFPSRSSRPSPVSPFHWWRQELHHFPLPFQAFFFFFHFSSCWSFVKLFSFVLVSYLFLQSFQSLKVLFHPATSQQFCQFVASILVLFVCLSAAGRTGRHYKTNIPNKGIIVFLFEMLNPKMIDCHLFCFGFFFLSQNKRRVIRKYT